MAIKEIIKTHKVKARDESGNFIKDEKGHFVWEEKEIRYRIDPDFIPEKIEDICSEFIDAYVEAHNQGEWFVDVLNRKEEIKNGKNKGKFKDISFVGIRSAFASEFFPSIIVGKAEKELSFRDKMLAKYGKNKK